MRPPTPRARPYANHVRRAMFLLFFIAFFAVSIGAFLRQVPDAALPGYIRFIPQWGSLIIVAVILFSVLFTYPRRRRSRAMAAAAAAVGANFIRHVDDSLGESLRHFGLFEHFGRGLFNDRDERISNLCYRQDGGLYVAVFDYQFRINSGEGYSSTCYRSALHVCSDKLRLPPFLVERKDPLHKLIKWLPFFNKGFEVEKSPDFVDRYIIRSEDEAAAKRHFTPDVVRFFSERHMPIVVEGREQELLCYFPNHGARSGLVLLWSDDERVSPAELPAWLQLGVQLASLFAADNDEIVDAVVVDEVDEVSGLTPPIRFRPRG